MKFEKLYKDYLDKKDSLVFTKDEIVTLIKDKFNATEFDFTDIDDLVNYEFFNYDKISLALSIQNKEILEKIYSIEEIQSHEHESKYHKKMRVKYFFINFKLNDKEKKAGKILINQQTGHRVDIVIESLDNEFISAYEVRYCETMDKYLNALVTGRYIQIKNKYGNKLYNLNEMELNKLGLYSDDRQYICKDLHESIDNESFRYYLENLYKFGFIGN
ncbi:hypothetical protein [Romboutsia lituseburensis]|uniref:hypothetical protein n=1 Tax=Romboutsia lituseburensis TaxID=1537 RepID=UPI00215B4710|nr:hypothetical protein [Romboutsia lituseburensis]MCR8745755.1 hypothetical protein [Romboutsia lituseburensis]